MSNQVKRVHAAVIDGRAQAPRFKQKQLVKLYDSLKDEKLSIITAICNDLGYSTSEAEVDYHLSLSTIKDFYSSLDFDKMLDEEYSLAQSKDNLAKRAPAGCIYIVPSPSSPFYSAVVPLAGAIAAGNCAVVEIKQTLSELSSLLRQLLTATLDSDTFAVVNSNPFENEFLDRHCVKLDTNPVENAVSTDRSLSTASARVVAIVDRSANLEQAARELVRARFCFRGQSSYAPDLILVNEFCVKDFCAALGRTAIAFLARKADDNTQKSRTQKSKVKIASSLQQLLEDDSVTTLVSGSRGTVAIVYKRDNKVLSAKVSEPILFVHAISSMDDAIDFVNSSNVNHIEAAYYFSTPKAAKYLSQFIGARISYVNHIPVELLVGPPAPTGFVPSIQPRYTKEMFSLGRPEIINTSEQSRLLADFLDNGKEGIPWQLIPKLEASVNELEGGVIGFFEQGLITGAFISLSTITIGVVLLGKYVYPAVATRLRWR